METVAGEGTSPKVRATGGSSLVDTAIELRNGDGSSDSEAQESESDTVRGGYEF